MNHGRRPHPYVTAIERDEVQRAISFARDRGWPITASITIHWAAAGGPGGGDWRARFNRLSERLRKQLARQGVPWAFIATHERTLRGKDFHTHIALHWPARLPIEALRAYLWEQLASNEPEVLRIDLCRDFKHGAHGLGRYITKGLSPEDHRRYRTPKVWREPQGEILGKRVTISRTVGATARRRFFDLGDAAAARRMAQAAAARNSDLAAG
jgi:hypothetical protein